MSSWLPSSIAVSTVHAAVSTPAAASIVCASRKNNSFFTHPVSGREATPSDHIGPSRRAQLGPLPTHHRPPSPRRASFLSTRPSVPAAPASPQHRAIRAPLGEGAPAPRVRVGTTIPSFTTVCSCYQPVPPAALRAASSPPAAPPPAAAGRGRVRVVAAGVGHRRRRLRPAAPVPHPRRPAAPPRPASAPPPRVPSSGRRRRVARVRRRVGREPARATRVALQRGTGQSYFL